MKYCYFCREPLKAHDKYQAVHLTCHNHPIEIVHLFVADKLYEVHSLSAVTGSQTFFSLNIETSVMRIERYNENKSAEDSSFCDLFTDNMNKYSLDQVISLIDRFNNLKAFL